MENRFKLDKVDEKVDHPLDYHNRYIQIAKTYMDEKYEDWDDLCTIHSIDDLALYNRAVTIYSLQSSIEVSQNRKPPYIAEEIALNEMQVFLDNAYMELNQHNGEEF
jgi:hypothetical protein